MTDRTKDGVDGLLELIEPQTCELIRRLSNNNRSAKRIGGACHFAHPPYPFRSTERENRVMMQLSTIRGG